MILFAIVLLLAITASVFVLNGTKSGVTAHIYKDGECVHSVDLSKVSESYVLNFDGEISNKVSVEPGRICVSNATCPDQICVRQGWISNSIVPIVCLPGELVIQIENEQTDLPDGIAS